MSKIEADYLPVLLSYASELKFVIVELSDLEEKMMINFRKRWAHSVELTNKSLTLTYDRQVSEALVEKAVASLKKWYREHYITLEQITKRSGKTTRCLLVKKRSI